MREYVQQLLRRPATLKRSVHADSYTTTALLLLLLLLLLLCTV
jgi:hypothetical protein